MITASSVYLPHKLIEKPNAINRDQETQIHEPQANLKFSWKRLKKQGNQWKPDWENCDSSKYNVIGCASDNLQTNFCSWSSSTNWSRSEAQSIKNKKSRSANSSDPRIFQENGEKTGESMQTQIRKCDRASSVKLDVQSDERGRTHYGFRGGHDWKQDLVPKNLLKVGLSFTFCYRV